MLGRLGGWVYREGRTLVVAAALMAPCGCASILGIDSGKPLPDAGSEDGPCQPDVATSCGAQACGQQLDPNCQIWVSCGPPCPSDGGGNCTPDASAACAGRCGGVQVQDQCSNWVSCSDPCGGAICYQGSCCAPYDPCATGGCGTFDICGTPVQCDCDASCTFQTCNASTCTDNCGVPCCSAGGDADAGTAACLGPRASCVPNGNEPCCSGTCTEHGGLGSAGSPSGGGPIMPEGGVVYWMCP